RFKQAEYLGDEAGLNIGDGRADMRFAGDKAIGFQLAQRLAHRNLADTQFVRQFVDHQPRTGSKFAVNNGCPQRSVNKLILAANGLNLAHDTGPTLKLYILYYRIRRQKGNHLLRANAYQLHKWSFHSHQFSEKRWGSFV